jgi:hypothetical protein
VQDAFATTATLIAGSRSPKARDKAAILLPSLQPAALTLENILAAYNEGGNRHKWVRGLQKALARTLALAQVENLAAQGSVWQRALLITNQARWAGRWLTVIPPTV